jgi:hypothetical protein
MWAFIDTYLWLLTPLVVGGIFAFHLAVLWIDYTDGRDDDRLTERLTDDLERELYGASEGNDGRRV